MPLFTSNKDNKPVRTREPIPPVISEEADKAIFSVLKGYLFTAFCMAVLCMVGWLALNSRFPHSRLLGPSGPVYYASLIIWLIPYAIGMNKQAALRLKFGRKYVAEHRWKEAAASLSTFNNIILKELDRTGEAHYLLAQALDKLGRKDKAEAARRFVIRNRRNTEWGARLAAAAQASVAPSAAQLRRKTAAGAGEVVARNPAPGRVKGRRRRF